MLGYFNMLLFGLFFVAIRVNSEEDIKGFIDILKTIQADDSASYPVISIGKLVTPDNIEICEAEIKSNNSPQEPNLKDFENHHKIPENENIEPHNSFDTTGDDIYKDLNRNDLHRKIQPINIQYHRQRSRWWPGFINQRFHNKWRPTGREWPSHYNYGYHHRPHGHHNHDGYNNHNSWLNQGYSPNYWNSYHNHNNYRPSYNERPSNNHEHFYHHRPSFHNNHNNERPNYSDSWPPHNETPSENNETNISHQPALNTNSNDDHIHQQTENPVTNYHDENLVNPITNAPPATPSQTENSPPDNENLDQLLTEIFGVPTTTEEFMIDQRIKEDLNDTVIYAENISQVSPVTPAA